MILVVAPNTALDRTLIIPNFREGVVMRTSEIIIAAGGKGMNVMRAAKIFGVDATYAGFAGGYIGRYVAALAEAEDFTCRWTWLEDIETRICTIIVDSAQHQVTVMNEYSTAIDAADWARLHEDVLAAARDAAVVCFSGSLPLGAPVDKFAELVQAVRAMGKPVWVDTSGNSLKTAAQLEGIGIKVNDEEIGAILGVPIESVEDAAQAAVRFAEQRHAPTIVTLGANGAVYADAQGCWHATPPPLATTSAVASGDCFLAGLVVSLTSGDSAPDALRKATAAGTANALSAGGGRFAKEDYDRVLAGTLVRMV